MLPVLKNSFSNKTKLTKSEIALLVEESKKGDIKAKEKLILFYINLINWNVRRHNKYNYIEEDDIYSYAFITFCDAIEKYDSTRGATFGTFVAYYMRHNMQRHIHNYEHLIYRPEALEFKPTERIEEYTNNNGETTDIELNVNRFDYLDSLIVEDEPICHTLMADYKKIDLNCLTPIQQKVIKAYYFEGKNYREIGKIVKISREGCRQSHLAAIKKLKTKLQKRL